MLKEQPAQAPVEALELPSPRWRRLRWTIWVLFVACWTRALLLPRPAQFVPYQPILDHFFLISKAVHVGAYAAFAVLSGWLLLPRPTRWLLLAFMSGHTFLTEYLQNFVEGRHPSFQDVGFDHLGIALGLACSWRWWRMSSSGQAVAGSD